MSAGHGVIRIVGRGCTVKGCGRPARELGGHCTPCWMGLAAADRAYLVWERETAANEVVAMLNDVWALTGPARGPGAA